MKLSPLRAGVAVGAILGLWHLAWCALVAIGWARGVLDFVLWAHFLNIPVELDAFAAGRAVVLVALTFAVGWVAGALFAVVWNRLHGDLAAAASPRR